VNEYQFLVTVEAENDCLAERIIDDLLNQKPVVKTDYDVTWEWTK